MKKKMCIILFGVTSLLMAQNKKVVTTYGEIVNHDMRLTTAQRDALPNKTVGMLIFNTTTKCHEFWDGSAWYNYCWEGTTPPAVVSAYSCSTASAGTMTAGTSVSGVTQTITATVTTAGRYDITSTANGVTFSGSGTFAGTGDQNIVLTASGTPTVSGTHGFALSTTPGCSFNRITVDPFPTVTTATGRVWMDRNLGAFHVATASNDQGSYGSLFQWGRGNDGHQTTSWDQTGTLSSSTTTLSVSDTPGNSLFIVNSSATYDWRSTKNDNLWQGVSGINNPCPAGYRIPTDSEFTNEFSTNGISNSSTAYSSVLKLPAAGVRANGDGALSNQDNIGSYWSSTVSGTSALRRNFSSGGTDSNASNRASGRSVRCIKD